MRKDSKLYNEVINEINDNEIKEYVKQQLMLDTLLTRLWKGSKEILTYMMNLNMLFTI